jgi:hypothetical protein
VCLLFYTVDTFFFVIYPKNTLSDCFPLLDPLRRNKQGSFRKEKKIVEREPNKSIPPGMSRDSAENTLGEVREIVFSKKNLVSLLLIGAKILVMLVKRCKNSD